LDRLRSALRSATGAATTGADAVALADAVAVARERFVAAMDDDFNTAGALGHLYDLVKAINTARDAGVGEQPLGLAQTALLDLAGVLGLTLQETDEQATSDAGPFIDLLVEVRLALRAEKQWALADLIRDRLAATGVQLEDSRDGTVWRWEK
ncbi:MAG: cysteine--tRNA ligase, partial [Caldilineales bacterium]|nr:cysteine--tRNA ligase [Caldilineales bacterium]